MPDDASTAFVRRIATYGLDGIDRRAEPLVAPTDDSWLHARSAMVAERLTGVAVLMVDHGALLADDECVTEMAELDRRWARHTLSAEDVLLAVADDLTAVDIEFRVLKGSALADLDWRWPQSRRWVDADVLVSSADFARVLARLEASGASRRVEELRAGFDRRFAKTVTLRSPAGPEIDLHRALILGPHTFLIPSEDLFREPRSYTVEGHALTGMGVDATLVHVCMHACFAGATRLASLRDVLEVARHADLDRVGAIARRWQITPALTVAAADIARRLDLPEHRFVRWAATLEPTGAERDIARVYAAGARTSRNLAVASLRYIPGLGDKARFALAYAVPDAANRAQRDRSGIDHARRIIDRMRPE